MKISSFSLLILLTLISGCATVGSNSATGPGLFYTEHTEGVIATSNQAGKKRGIACTENYLGLFTTGDASIGAAMKNGAITTIQTADRTYHSIMSVYGKMCLVVTGN